MGASRDRVTYAGLPCDVAIGMGTPYQVIIDTARSKQVDLIVMGTHGRTGLRHLFLGSVAEHVVQLTPCVVLVVRVPAPTPDTARMPGVSNQGVACDLIALQWTLGVYGVDDFETAHIGAGYTAVGRERAHMAQELLLQSTGREV